MNTIEQARTLGAKVPEDREPEWATVQEAARIAAVSVATVRRRVTEGVLRSTKPTPQILRVDLNSVRAWLEAGELVA